MTIKSGAVTLGVLGFPEDGLPYLISNETLYSWCSRFHRLTCFPDTQTTACLLFGDVRSKNRHDFPGHLSFFDYATNGKIGNIDNLLCQHTMLLYHKPFLNPAAYSKIREAMLEGEVAVVHRRLGLTKSGWTVPAPLKACPKCMSKDESEYQIAYWHREHQWPSVHICLDHDEPLLIAHDFMHQSTARGWWLPRDVSNSSWQYPQLSSNIGMKKLIDLAQWTTALVSWDGIPLSEKIIRFCYLLQSKKHNWVALDGSLRFQLLCNAFWKMHQCISNRPGIEFIQDTQRSEGGFLKLLLRNFGGQRHPFKHLLMMQFLYDGPSEFFQHYITVHEIFENDGVDGVRRSLLDTRAKVREMITGQGLSLNAAAASIGVTTGMIVRFARQSGIEYKKRPRLLNSEKESELKRLLAEGETQSAIAKTLSLSVKYIRSYLAANPCLRKSFQSRLKERERLARRMHFLEVLELNPGVPIKRIRRIPGNGFEWLYRNDLEWLKQHLPKIWSR